MCRNGVRRQVIVSLAVVLTLCACNRKAPPETAETALPVTVAPVVEMEVSHELQRVGTLTARESVMVKSEVKGLVEKIFFAEGTAVHAGELLVKLEDAKLEAEVRRLKARINQLEVTLANSIVQRKRKAPLVKENLVSEQEFDDLVARIKEQRAALEQAKAELARAEELLEDTEIRAPFDGVTSDKKVSVGDYLDEGAPIVRIVQLDPLEISFRVDEKFRPSLYLGQPVSVKVQAYPEKRFGGEVFFISPDVDPGTRTVLVKGLVANPAALLNPGMFAAATIITSVNPDALVIPWESVVELEEEMYVYALNTKKVRKVPVRLGKIFNGKAEVIGELSPGDLVVVEGKYALEEGATVEVIEYPEAPS